MSMINRSIPEFSCQAFHNGEFKTVTSEDVKGNWAIFLFYPADFTFVCPTELEDMAKHHEELLSLGVEVYSVSTDTHFTHKAWHDTSDAIGTITYPMLGDPTGTITRGFDVMIEEDGLALRGTFLVNPEGIVKVAEIHDLGIGRSAKDMVRKVKAAQYVATHDGEVCPAAWEEGEETLTPSLDLVGKI
ncbi:MAG: alkyl hydroperoxide reductase subunit C [Granulosicoccaceae bacterium]